jgi:hypothetical protein
MGLCVQWLNDIVAYMKNQGAGADGQHSAIDNWFWCAVMQLQLPHHQQAGSSASTQVLQNLKPLLSCNSSQPVGSAVCRWAWPTNSGDTKGIVDTNWLDIRFDKACVLSPCMQSPSRPDAHPSVDQTPGSTCST